MKYFPTQHDSWGYMETDCTAVYLGCVCLCCAIVLYHHRQAVFVRIIIRCVLPAIQASTVLFINSLISLFWIWSMGLRSSLGLWTDKSFGGLSLEVTDGEFNSSRCQASLGVSYCKWCWNTSSLSINLRGNGNHHTCSEQPAQAWPLTSDWFLGKQRPWQWHDIGCHRQAQWNQAQPATPAGVEPGVPPKREQPRAHMERWEEAVAGRGFAYICLKNKSVSDEGMGCGWAWMGGNGLGGNRAQRELGQLVCAGQEQTAGSGGSSAVRDGCCWGARGHLGLRKVQGAAHGAESSCFRPGSSARRDHAGLAGSWLETCKVMCNTWNLQVYRLRAHSQAWRRTACL